MMRQPSNRASAGMTLIELMVVIGVSALVGLVVTTVLFSSAHVGARTSRRAEIQGGSRQALSMMTTELRQAGADPRIPPTGVVGIVSADSTQIHIRADLNGDGIIQTAEPSEEVTYAWTDSTEVLTRDPGTGPEPVLSNVRAMSLTYFDESNTQLTALPLSATDAARVHSIRISLTAEEGDSHPITLTTRASLRNR
jgi:type IV pilus assembly protein PilW